MLPLILKEAAIDAEIQMIWAHAEALPSRFSTHCMHLLLLLALSLLLLAALRLLLLLLLLLMLLKLETQWM